MKIRILKSMAGLDFSYVPGQVVERPDEEAKRWIAAGLAVPVEDLEATAVEPPEKAVLPAAKRKKVR